MRRFLGKLHVQVLIGVVAGIALGYFASNTGPDLNPLGDPVVTGATLTPVNDFILTDGFPTPTTEAC